MGNNHHAVDRSWHRAQISITRLALDLGGVGINRNDFMTRVPKPAKDCIGRAIARSRHPGHDYALSGKEGRYRRGYAGHVIVPAKGNSTATWNKLINPKPSFTSRSRRLTQVTTPTPAVPSR